MTFYRKNKMPAVVQEEMNISLQDWVREGYLANESLGDLRNDLLKAFAQHPEWVGAQLTTDDKSRPDNRSPVVEVYQLGPENFYPDPRLLCSYRVSHHPELRKLARYLIDQSGIAEPAPDDIEGLDSDSDPED